MKRFTLVLTLISFFSICYSQVEIPVDMYTGKPSITVPIWTITSRDISEPIVLSYDANSATSSTLFGAGWSLQAGGSVTRQVRSFPDDVGAPWTSPYPTTPQGWLYSNAAGSIATYIGNFTPTADTSAISSTDEFGSVSNPKDWERINGFNYLVDTEPDIFNFSAGGISGSFVIDNGLVIRTMPYQDIKIEMTTTSATDKRIQSFKITTNTGYVYTFDYKLSATRTSSESLYANRSFYFMTDFELYKTAVIYTQEWKLTKIESPNGANITFGYTSGAGENSYPSGGLEIGLYQYPDPLYANPEDIFSRSVYGVGGSAATAKLTTITASTGPKAELSYNSGPEGTLKTITVSDTRRGVTTGEQYIKSFSFGYESVFQAYKASWGALEYVNPIQYLMSVTETSGCEQVPPYKFSYVIVHDPENPLVLPYLPITENGVDLWGYPNGVKQNGELFPKLYIYPSEPAAERYRYTPIPGYVGQEVILEGANRSSSSVQINGTLSTITSPEGGMTHFAFECNQYLDTRTDQNVNAGGLRIKSISYLDGFNSTPIKKTFEYNDPVTGKSWGRLIRKPVFYMPAYRWKSSSGSSNDKTYASFTPGSDDAWKYLTIRTSKDLTGGESTHGSPVGYTMVTVKRPGAGSARYQYHLPATYGQFSSGSWKSTINMFARHASSVSMGIVEKGGSWTFPNTPHPDYDYQRGLPWKKWEYNEAGVLVKYTETTYQDIFKSGSTPYKVWGLKYDRYAGCDNDNKIFFYGKYFLLTEAQRVPLKETTKIYDPATSTYLRDSTEYQYLSSNHKLVTNIKRMTSDGKTYTTKLKYPGDYLQATSGASDAMMIKSLKDAFRNGTPIEQTQTLTRNDSTWVIGGSVIKLDPMGLNRPLVRSTWQLKTSPPILQSSFQESSVVNSSGYKFKIDSRYERTDSVLAYTSLGDVKVSRNPFSRQTSVIGYGYNSTLPVVQLINAQLASPTDVQAGFSDFENTTGFEFSHSTPYYGTGRSGTRAFYPWVMLYKTVTKVAVPNYILSFWVKSNTQHVFNIYLKNASGTQTYTTTITVPSTGSEYKYIQKVIPVNSIYTTTFKIEIQASGLSAPPTNNPPAGGISSSLLPVIDDVFFYPENADMVATSYNIPYGATVVTSGTGSTSYNEHDKLGRLRFVYDKNKDIIKRNVYQYNATSPLVADFSIPYPYTVTVGVPTTFTAATNDCVTDATYEWNWGGGYLSGSAVQAKTFTTVGTYQISLRVTSATYGVKTITKPIEVVYAPFEIDICAKGATYFVDDVPDVIAVCSSITTTAPANGVIFKVTHQGLNPVTYQWKIKDFEATEWTNVGGNSDQYVIKSFPPGTKSFEVMCLVTSGSGVGNSPKIEVIFESNN